MHLTPLHYAQRLATPQLDSFAVLDRRNLGIPHAGQVAS